MPKLLQNASVITKCRRTGVEYSAISMIATSYHKIGESYYNLRQLGITNCVDRQLLQNAATLVTKCVSYYKIRRLLQNAAEQSRHCHMIPLIGTFNIYHQIHLV